MSFRMIRTLGLLVLGLLALSPRAYGSDAPAPAFPSMATAHLGPVRATKGMASWALNHGSLQFSGRWAPILQDKEVVGLFMVGRGTLTYTSTFEPERPVFTRNVKDQTPIEMNPSGKSPTLPIHFKEARLFLAGAPVPSWEGEAAETMETSYAQFDGRWSKVDGHIPSHLLALQASNAPGKAVAILELELDDQHWLYTYDGVQAMEETIQWAKSVRGVNPDTKDWQYLIGLSRQPIGWDPRKGLAPTHFRLSALDVDLRTKDNRNTEVVVQETILPLEDGLQVFSFELWSDLALEKDTRVLRVTKVTDGEGHVLPFTHSHDKLAVRLPAPARRGVTFTLRMEYSGDFLIQPGGDSYWQLGVRDFWYPTPASMASESYLFHGTVRTKGEWLAFLPGETVRREKDGEWNLVETRTTQPITFATILGGKYFVDEETHDGLTVRIATYGFKPGRANQVFKSQAFNVIRYYQNFLGPFPFKEFLIIEKNEWGYGQAPSGMMYITRDAFEQLQEARRAQELAELITAYGGRDIPGGFSFRTMDVRHVFAHEIAHQYWGTVVKMPSPEEQWITESFADYCAALFEGELKGKGVFEKNVGHWEAKAADSAGKAPIPLANDFTPKDAREHWFTRTNLLYAKGPVLLHALHQELGDKVFLTWLKSIQANFRWKFATTRQMFDLLGFITKKDYMPFYNDYYWGLALPPKKP